MRRFGRTTIQSIVIRAIKEFYEDDSSPDFVSFYWKGHYVEAIFEWSNSRGAFYLSSFSVVYSRCVMTYNVHADFDLRLAWCL